MSLFNISINVLNGADEVKILPDLVPIHSWFFLSICRLEKSEYPLTEEIISIFLFSRLITLIPMIITTVIAKTFFKLNMLTLLGTLTGSMTSTPGLAAVDNLVDTDAPSVAYATVYPIAMVLLIIVVQILSLL